MTKKSVYTLLLTTTLISSISFATDDAPGTPSDTLRTKQAALKTTPEIRKEAESAYPSDVFSPVSQQLNAKFHEAKAREERDRAAAEIEKQLTEREMQKALETKRAEVAARSAQELEQLRAKLELFSAKLQANQTKGSETERKVALLITQISGLKEKISETEQLLDVERTKRRDTVTAASDTVDTLTRQLKEYKTTIAALEATRASLTVEKETIAYEKDALERKIALYDSQIAGADFALADTLDPDASAVGVSMLGDGVVTADTPSVTLDMSTVSATGAAGEKKSSRPRAKFTQ